MFKKINSNRDPEANFFTELKKEFGGNLAPVKLGIINFFEKYPRPIVYAMMVIIGLSAAFSFGILIPMEKKRLQDDLIKKEAESKPKPETVNQPLPGNNIDDVIAATGNLKAAFKLQRQIDIILSKPHLTAQDSLQLRQLLDEYKKYKNTNPIKR